MYTGENTWKKIKSIIVKDKSWKYRKEFYDARPKNSIDGNKKEGLNFFNVSVDLTSRRYLLLKAAVGVYKSNSNISFVYPNINCSLCSKFKNGSFKYFNSLNELHSLL